MGPSNMDKVSQIAALTRLCQKIGGFQLGPTNMDSPVNESDPECLGMTT